jgi:Skp family chaperone for outer membrane proteins
LLISRLPIFRVLRPAAFASSLIVPLSPVFAQSNPGFFIPPSAQQSPARPAPAARAPVHRAPAPPAVQPVEPLAQSPGPVAGPGAEEGPPMQLQLPPAPELPAMAKGSPPPAATIGVLGIPEIMRASGAAQQVEKTIGERREKLNEDAQKEQMAWREMQQSLANERSKLNAEQIRAKEKELQDRITAAQKTFRDRNRIIQQAGQYGLAQIERMLVSVIREVAESRGMNLVLHRAQVALNVNEFDITDQVVEQMNKVLPSVVLPPDGVAPPMAAATPPAAPGASPTAASPGAPSPAAPALAKPSTPAPPQGSASPAKK